MDGNELFNWGVLMQLALRIGVILLLCWLILQGLKILIDRLEQYLLQRDAASDELPWELHRRIETLTRLLRQVAYVLVLAAVALAVLMQLGVQVGPILASAGILGLAVGFGAQNLVRDLISGFFMILENQVRVGDVVIVNGTGGLVEAVNLRTLVLRDESGVVHVFPNGAVTTLANMTREWSAYVFSFSVGYQEDVDRVIEIVRRVGRELKADRQFGSLMLSEPDIYGVDRLGDTGVVIKGRIRTRPIRQWDVGREFLRRIKYAFDAAAIEIPLALPRAAYVERKPVPERRASKPDTVP